MKKLFLSLAFLLVIISVRAQTPQGINYQGVARDAFGNAISKQSISVQLQLHQGSSGGSVAFSEVHTVTTDTFGLYNFVIGSANQSGFNSVNWSTGNFWLEVDIDPTGTATSFVPVSTSQLMSVPYALYAGNSGSGTVTSLTGGTGIDASPSTITTTGTFSLAPSGVTPGTFGTATQIPVITVDAMGRVTGISTQTVAASTTSITTTGGGITSNALSNSYTLTVDNTIAQWNASQIQNVPVTVSGLSNGQILQYNGSNWVNINPPAPPSITTTGGGITSNTSGNSYTLTVDNTIAQWNASQIQNTPVTVSGLSNGQMLQYNGSNWVNVNPPPLLPPSSGGEILYSNSGTWSPSNTSNLFFNGNMLGIGNNTPAALLDAKSTSTTPAIMATNTGTGPAIVSNGPLSLGGTLLDYGNAAGSNGDILVSQGSGIGPKWMNPSTLSNWTVVGNGIFPSTTTLNVGVGTGSPNYQLDIVNTSTTSTAVNILNNGQGNGIDIQNNFTGSSGPSINVYHGGTGPSVYISSQNTAANADGVYIETKGPGNAFKSYTDAGGNAIYGYHHGATSGSAAIYGMSDNMGSAGIFRIMNTISGTTALDVLTTGTGFSGTFSGGAGLQTDKIQITAGAAPNYVLTSDAAGNASWQPASGGGGLPAGTLGQILYYDGSNWVGTTSPNLFFSGTQLGIGTNAPSAGIDVQGGAGVAGNFANAGNSGAVNAQNAGVGSAINATNAGTGSAGVFQNTNSSNTQPVLSVVNSPASTGKSAIFSGGSGVQIDNLQVQTNLNIPLNANPGFVLTSDVTGNATWQPAAGGVTSISATAPITSTGGANPSIGITQASGTANGFLSSADWNTFNSKLSTVAVSGPVIGNGTGGAPLGLGLNNGLIFVGNGSNLAAPVSMTGDVNINNTGLTNLSPTGVTPGSYGTSTSVPQISVDAKGRITSAGTVAIAGTLPAGANGQMLFNNGSSWVPTNPNNLFYTGTNMGINNNAPLAALDAVSTTTTTAVKATNLSGGVAVFANGPLKLGSHIVDAVANAGATGDVLVSQSAGAAPKWMNPSTITAAGGAWVTSGNSASASDFLGTTNAADLVVKTNNNERMRIDQTGLVSIGTGAPSTGPTLEVLSTGTAPTIKGINNGSTGPAGTFTVSNAANSSTVLTVSTIGAGAGISVNTVDGDGVDATTSGTSGSAGNFKNTNAGNNNPVVNVTAVGAGAGVNVNTSASGAGVASTSTGSGVAGYFNLNNSSGTNNALMVTSNTGAGATIYANNSNGGGVADLEILAAGNNSPVLTAMTTGGGIGANITVNNASNMNTALSVSHNGSGYGAGITQSGTGSAGFFQVTNTSSSSTGLISLMNGNGDAFYAFINHPSSGGNAINGNTAGTGRAGYFTVNNSSNTSDALYTSTDGSGSALSANTTGTGRAGYFSVNNTGNANDAVYVFTNGSGNALTSYASGSGYAVYGNNNNASSGGAAGFFNSNSSNAVSVQNSGNGNAIGAAATGSSGNAGFFQVNNAGNTGNAVLAMTNGSGSAIQAQNTGVGYSGTFVGGAGFKVDGMQMNFRIASNGVNTLTSTDYFLLIPVGTAGSINLPSASIAGKVFVIKNLSPSSFTISPPYTSTTGITNQTSVTGNTVLHLVSDGSTWQAW